MGSTRSVLKQQEAGQVFAVRPSIASLAGWLTGGNLAAPGLTLHGRARAIDFQVMEDGAIHAGASSKEVDSVWRAEGWDVKLKASITAAGP